MCTALRCLATVVAFLQAAHAGQQFRAAVERDQNRTLRLAIDQILGLPVDFPERLQEAINRGNSSRNISVEMTPYLDMDEFFEHIDEYDLLFVPTTALVYLKEYYLLGSTTMAGSGATNMTTSIITRLSDVGLVNVTTEENGLVKMKMSGDPSVGYLNRFCITAYFTIMKVLGSNRVNYKKVSTTGPLAPGFLGMLEGVIYGEFQVGSVWTPYLLADPLQASRVHVHAEVPGLPTPVLATLSADVNELLKDVDFSFSYQPPTFPHNGFPMNGMGPPAIELVEKWVQDARLVCAEQCSQQMV